MTAYEFGEWRVEPELGRVRRGQDRRHLEPKALEVLIYLLADAGQVVSSEALLQNLWQGKIVEPSAVPRNVALIRRALGDDPRKPRYIETIPKQGYRTVAPVRLIEPQSQVPDALTDNRGDAVTLAVLPFDNLSADTELVYFSDGLSEEILQTVAKSVDVRVIGRTSSFQFRGADKEVRKVASALGCTHALDGSVRRSGRQVRISAQLIDCARQTTVWSDRFDAKLEDVFALQEGVAAAVAQALDLAFSDVAGGRHPIDPVAFDLYLQAKANSTQWLGACDAGLLEQAIAKAPTFAKAWATLAVTRAIDAHVEREPARSEPIRQQTLAAAERALELDQGSATAYAALSIVEPICGRFQERDALMASALQAEPADAVSLFWACRWNWAVGRHQEGLDYIARACQVEPLWAQGLHQYATMLWMVGKQEDAGNLWDRLTRDWPDRDYLWVVPLGLHAHVGNWQKVDELTARLAETELDTERTRRRIKQVQRLRGWSQSDTDELARELISEVERTGTLRLYLQWACEHGLTHLVYELLERASFAHLFEPSGRLHVADYGLHALFVRLGDAMYRDPRFVQLCGRLGLCDYWTRTDRWPDCADYLSCFYDFRGQARALAAPSARG